MKRLNELGLLGHVYAISATSGGAITAGILQGHRVSQNPETGAYAYDWNEFERKLLNTARRGLLGRTTVLVSAYIFYAIAIVTTSISWVGWHLPATVLIILWGGAVLCHISLLTRLIRDKAYRNCPIERSLARLDAETLPAISAKSVTRFVRMLFFPSALRMETLNAELFHGCRLHHLSAYPSLYLNAVNLNDGIQYVFSNAGVFPLDSPGCTALWLCRPDPRFSKVTLARAVAASSAIPLFFRPVTVWYREWLSEMPLGVFVDGGVADNLAVNVVKGFATFLNPNRVEFNECTSLVLIADGSMPLISKKKKSWTRVLSLKRISDAMMNQHVADVQIYAHSLHRNLGVPTWIMSLQMGIPDFLEDKVPIAKDVLRQVRTHLDSFNLQECAVLAYCGYGYAEALIRGGNIQKQYGGATYVDFRNFQDILPPEAGEWDSREGGIKNTMRFSNRRLLAARWLGRTLGI